MSFLAELRRRNVLRVVTAYIFASWLIIQVVETLFPVFGLSDAAIRAAVVVLAVGLLPVVVLAWAFELTPEGLKRDKDIDRSQSVRADAGKKLDRVIMVVLALALGFFALDKFVISPQRQAAELERAATQAREEGRVKALTESYGDKSIAVLPFVNMSPDPEQAYFADGISEELLNLLAKIPELRVISRTSAFSLKGENLDAREIAERLNVANVLEGSVRRSGATVRITAQLIEARSDTHLWSQTYDRTLDDIFVIQDEIAAAVVEQLKIKLLGASPNAVPTNPETYTLYLRARDMLRQPGFEPETHQQIVDLLTQALDYDADFVPALTALALAHFTRRGTEGTSAAELERLAWQAIERALVIDPNDATANAYQAFRSSYEGDFATAAKGYERAFAEDPANEDVLRTLTVFLRAIGRTHLAASVGEYGVRRNPLCSQCLYSLAHVYLSAGRLDEAESSFRRMAMLFGGAQHSIGMTLLLKGQPQLALEAFDEHESDAYQYQGRALALHDLGRHAESQEALSRLLDFGSGDIAVETNATLLAEAYAWLGETDAAFAELARQLEPPADASMPRPAIFIANQLQDPIYRKLHADPRWEALLRKHGISASQLAAIQVELKIPDG